MAHVPEGRRIFTELTVLENLEMGAFTRNDAEQIKKDMEHMFSLFPRLAERKKQLAGTMSGGEQLHPGAQAAQEVGGRVLGATT